jgi:hypothetical protein
MNILAFWKRRLAEKRAARRANTQSKKIDRRLQEESKQSKQRPHDVLLIGSCFLFLRDLLPRRTD